MTKVERSQGLVIVVLISVVYGLASIPMGLLIAGKSTGVGFVPLIFAAFRSCALITLVVAAFSTLVFVVLGILDRRTFRPHQPQVRYALLIASGIFVISFFLIFDRFYNKFQAFLVTEIIGGLAALVVGIISYLLLRSRDRLGRLQNISSGLALFGVLTVLALFVLGGEVLRAFSFTLVVGIGSFAGGVFGPALDVSTHYPGLTPMSP